MSVRLHIRDFQSIKDAEVVVDGFTVVTGPNNSGKALAHGTGVATQTGWSPVETIHVGDVVLAGSGEPTSVIGVFPQGLRDVWEVRFNDGRAVVVDAEHQWLVSLGEGRFPKGGSDQSWVVVTTTDLIRRVGSDPKGAQRPAIPFAGPAQYTRSEVPLDPYLFGLLLGDGCLQPASVRLSTADPEISNAARTILPEGLSLVPCGKHDFRISGGRRGKSSNNRVLDVFRDFGLIEPAHKKHIPHVYRYNDPDIRLAILQGLMDTDGWVEKSGGVCFSSSSARLASDVREIVWSLGGTAAYKERQTSYTYKGSRLVGRTAHHVQFRLPGFLPFRLTRKLDRIRPASRRFDPLIVSIHPAGKSECTCIAVDHPSHLFQVDGHIVTHNTAVQRAVSGVFSNPGGDAYVRHGTEKFSVEVGFTDGNTVRWEKGPKTKPTYILNGKTIYPGRAVPEEVLDLGIRPIQAGTGQVWPQLAPQFTGQVFLLDMSGSSVAEAVADVERVGKLTQALRLAEADKRSASSEVKVRRQDVVNAKGDLSEYDGVEVVTAHVRELEKSLGGVVALSKEVQDSRGTQQHLDAARAGVQAFAGFTPNCLGEDLVPESRDLVVRLAVARSLKGQVEAGRSSVLKMSGIRDFGVPMMPASVGGLASQLAIARQLRETLVSARAGADTTRRAVVVIQGVDLETAGGASVKAQRVEAALGVYKSMQARLAQGNKNVAILRDLLKKKSADLTDTENEVGVTLGSLGSCPVCRTPSTGSPHSH